MHHSKPLTENFNLKTQRGKLWLCTPFRLLSSLAQLIAMAETEVHTLSSTGYQQVMNFTKKVQLRGSALSKGGGMHWCAFHVMWSNVRHVEITLWYI